MIRIIYIRKLLIEWIASISALHGRVITPIFHFVFNIAVYNVRRLMPKKVRYLIAHSGED